MSNVFFTSDTHFFHEKLVPMRGFQSVDDMNDALVTAWNETVRPNDLIYHLGDVTFGKADASWEVMRWLHGQKHFIRGNHDGVLDKMVRKFPKLATTYRQYHEIGVEGQRIVLFHFPILSWHGAHRGWWHLHGHCHGNLSPSQMNGPMLDVGVDNIDGMRPWSMQDLHDYMKGWRWAPVDQHGSVGDG